MRHAFKAKRHTVSAIRRMQAEKRACQFLVRSTLFRTSESIAAYISVKSEFRTRFLLETIMRQHKKLYLPVLQDAPQQSMQFIRYTTSSRLKQNRYGIPEPQAGKKLPAQRLDLVIMPLLGFDAHGNRLGMGGGYYDRSFAFCMHISPLARPFLLGLAYDVQEVNTLDVQPWDVPLDAVLTESGIRYF